MFFNDYNLLQNVAEVVVKPVSVEMNSSRNEKSKKKPSKKRRGKIRQQQLKVDAEVRMVFSSSITHHPTYTYFFGFTFR
jgi:hypothetical protein